MRGNCITYEALKLADSGTIEAVIAEFDRAIAAYRQGPADSHLANSLSWARSQARFTLARLAKSTDDWNAVIAAHEAWANAPGADDQARKELAKVRVARANDASTDGRTAAGIHDAQAQFAAALKADPDNVNARNGQIRTDEQARRLADSQAIVRAMTARRTGNSTSGGLQGLAGRQAKAAVAGGDCPWQTSKGCQDSADTSVVVVPSSGFAFASPKEETSAQVTIHAQITAKQAENEKLVQQLAQTPDPFQRMKVKTQLSKGEQELSAKKDEYVKAGKPHFIEPRQ